MSRPVPPRDAVSLVAQHLFLASQFVKHGKLGLLREPSLPSDAIARQIEAIASRMLDGARQIAVHGSEVGLDQGISEQESAQAILYTLIRFSEAKPGAFSIADRKSTRLNSSHRT